MHRITLAVTLALLVPGAAHAVTGAQCASAMDFDSNAVGPVSYPQGVADMAQVTSNLGIYVPFEGSTMCILSTGDTANITNMFDYDWPGTGADTSAGDRITVEFDVTVPPWANSFFFRHNFFSREYPEWVGSAFNDGFEIHLTGAAWSGQMVFDSVGNPISVNSAFFTVTTPALLAGTGFDQDGSTGWLVSIAPVLPNDVITLSMTIYDTADGVWDSAVLLDDFEWSTSQVTMPYTDHADPEGGFQNPPPPPSDYAPAIAYVSPKEGARVGGQLVTLVGARLTDVTDVFVGDAQVPVDVLDDSTLSFTVPSAADAGVPEGGPVTVRAVAGNLQSSLADAFTYHPADAPNTQSTRPSDPRVDLVWPMTLAPGLATDIEITGPHLAGGRVELEASSGERFPVDVQSEESGPVDVLTVALPALTEDVYAVRVHGKADSAIWAHWLRVEAPPAVDEPAGCAVAPANATWLWLLVLLAVRRLIGRGPTGAAPRRASSARGA